MKLLIVDTDRDQVEMLTSLLKTQGYEVSRAYTGERARQEWHRQQPDIVIIDPTLHDMDGLTLCREMRTKHEAMVLIMMDGKGVQDEVHCLNAGADDYLQKPFFPAQFLAHLRAISRRGSAHGQQSSSVITIGAIRIDSLHNEVTIDNKTIHLTPTESKLLHLLAANANTVCTAHQIVTHVWGFSNNGDAALIKTHIRHLRQKIERDPSRPTYILTVPGVGYTLARHREKTGSLHDAKDMAHSLQVASF